MAVGIETDLFNSNTDKLQRLIDTFSTGTSNGTRYIPDFNNSDGAFFAYPDQGNAETDAAVYPTLSWNNNTKIMSWTFQNNDRKANQFVGGVNFIQGATQKRSVQVYCLQFGGTPSNGYGFQILDENSQIVVDDTFRGLAFANEFTQTNPASPQNYQPPGGGISGYYIRNLGDLADGTHGTYTSLGGTNKFDGDDALCAVDFPTDHRLHGLSSDSSGNPALNITNASGSGGATIEQWIIAPATAQSSAASGYGIAVYDTSGNITFQSEVDYAELLGTQYIPNIQDISRGSYVTINHNAAKSGYKPAYLFTVTVPSVLHIDIGESSPRGAGVYYFVLQEMSSTSCRAGWFRSFSLPFPSGSTFYEGITITGRIDANVAVFAVPD